MGEMARRTPSTVAARSCIASSSADWVRGVVRLTSSARRTSVKTGPGWKTNSWVLGSKMLVPTRSTGIRSGVNWMRRNRHPRSRESARARSVFPVPGTPSMSPWPPASRHARTRSFNPAWPRMTVSSPSRSRENARCTSSSVVSGPAKAVLIAEPFPGGDEAPEPRSELAVGEPATVAVVVGNVLAEERLGALLPDEEAQRDLVHEVAAVQAQRFAGRERPLVEGGHRIDQLHRFAARIAPRIRRRPDRDGMAPGDGARAERREEERRTETPAAQEAEDPGVGAGAVEELVEHHRAAAACELLQEHKVVCLGEVLVEEQLWLGKEPDLARPQRSPRDRGRLAVLEDGLRIDESRGAKAARFRELQR